jgi:hypothetical protein
MPHGAALAPTLTPHGRLRVAPADDATALPEAVGERRREAFERGAGHGLLQLGAGEVATALPAVFSYWRELGSLFVSPPASGRTPFSTSASTWLSTGRVRSTSPGSPRGRGA